MKRLHQKIHLADQLARHIFQLSAFIAGTLVFLIIAFIAWRGVRVFLPTYPERQSVIGFLTGLRWRADQGVYGVLFIIINTLISAVGAALLVVPPAILSALFIVKMAPRGIARLAATVVELLAAIPSVVFGVFAAAKVCGFVDALARRFHYQSFGGNSLLSVIILLAIMIYPTVTSVSMAALRAVPRHLELGALALGATPSETYFKLVIPAARSGIVTALVLGLGRAFGEATAVSMVAGNAFFGPSFNPFAITRTLTSTMLSGLHETSGLDYDIRFSVGLVLLVMILMSNLIIYKSKARLEAR